MGLEPTTVVVGEPAASFTYDPKRSLYDQFSKAQGVVEGEGELEAAVRRADEAMSDGGSGVVELREIGMENTMKDINDPFLVQVCLTHGALGFLLDGPFSHLL